MEKFCDSDVYVLAKFDSYDEDPDDLVKGQIEETLETDNVASTTAGYRIGMLDCSGAMDITDQKCAYSICNVVTCK